jgi:hypothetical protein
MPTVPGVVRFETNVQSTVNAVVATPVASTMPEL